ncbi:tryptophan synthase subunit alpha [Helicobacter sp. 13S00477-4]|uniref:tryptophan synthase subunit alpha n=1 Tax=Helicobacter sp. 13S00477-4 TaxID=1905759 RepID=UPI000BA4EF54|nr:tryptophan synthase subunit alpha [Helicobacter sp. 13S00477-4]PAF52620.1 tryptophan synthase subunit alpha [Helicobacter sp. 13S00477-4]
MKNIQFMGHIIAGYPNKKQSIEAAMGICEGGADFLEIQFPFSDPNADGPIIENACNIALKNGFEIKDGFEITNFLSTKYTNTKIIIMTYANIIFTFGIEKFIKKAKLCGVIAIIIPDLTFESDEGLRSIAKNYHIHVIELITPGMPAKRIQKLSKNTSCEFVYVVARSGITGEKTCIDEFLFEWIDFVRKNCTKKIALGFGIQNKNQIQALKDKIDIVVAGSYFVKKIASLKDGKNTLEILKIHTTNLFPVTMKRNN